MNSETSTLLGNQMQIHRLDQLYRDDQDLFFQMVEYMPLLVTINSVGSLDWVYCNDAIKELAFLEKGFVLEAGWGYLKNHIHPENLRYQTVVFERFRKQDSGQPLSYFQYVRKAGKKDYFWLHTYKKFLTDDRYISVYYNLNLLGKAAAVLDQYLGRIALSKKAYLKYHSLTRREKEILKMVAIGYSNREIGNRLFISELTVKTHRKNLGQKLELKNLAETIHFATAIQLFEQGRSN